MGDIRHGNHLTGFPASKTDADNGLTTTFTYDDIGRPATVVEAGQRRTLTTYSDQLRTVTIQQDLGTLNDSKIYAGLGDSTGDSEAGNTTRPGRPGRRLAATR